VKLCETVPKSDFWTQATKRNNVTEVNETKPEAMRDRVIWGGEFKKSRNVYKSARVRKCESETEGERIKVAETRGDWCFPCPRLIQMCSPIGLAEREKVEKRERHSIILKAAKDVVTIGAISLGLFRYRVRWRVGGVRT